METMEHQKVPEIHTDELLRTLASVKWEEGEQIQYNNTTYLLFFAEELSESDNYSQASYFASQIVDFDIYILERLPFEEKRRCLFHEILEANLQTQGFEEEEAHKITVQEEERVFGKRVKQ